MGDSYSICFKAFATESVYKLVMLMAPKVDALTVCWVGARQIGWRGGGGGGLAAVSRVA